MSIHITGKLNKAAAVPADESHGQKSPAKAGNDEFARALAAALNKQVQTGGSGLSAVSAAALMRLDMLRGSLLGEGSDTGRAKLPALSNIRLSKPSAQRVGQKYDQSGGKKQARAIAKQQPGSKSLDNVINRAARHHGVEPALVKAVIKAESGFDNQAVSSAGAKGLMQLMPDTAKDLGVSNSFDANQNVMAGTRYLKQLLDRYDGDMDAALAAYNWGPGNVDRKGLASLPKETRTYLARVKTYYNDYTA